MTTDKVLREPGQLIADKFASFENGFFSQLPNIIVAAVFLLRHFLRVACSRRRLPELPSGAGGRTLAPCSALSPRACS